MDMIPATAEDATNIKASKLIIEQPKTQQLEPAPDSNTFSDIVTRLVMGKSLSKPAPNEKANNNSNSVIQTSTLSTEQQQPTSNDTTKQQILIQTNYPLEQVVEQTTRALQQFSSSNNNNNLPPPPRQCRAPMSRKFAQPCTCSQSNHNKFFTTNNNNNNSTQAILPPAAFTSPLHLYDPVSRKCLPTSRNRDMLLKECHITNSMSTFPVKPHHITPCAYDDLVCDSKRFRCVCKPPLHLYYESNLSRFGCVPMVPQNSPDGRVNCRPGYIYNVISKECQKVFDITDLPANYSTGVSPTQFSFVTIVLIWILLLILIVTAKLRKLRTSNLYRNSPPSERRLHHGNPYRHHGPNRSAWLHPFIAAVNGHHHLNNHRTTVDRFNQNLTVDESGNYNDTDFFLANGNRRINDLTSDQNFVGSQQSLNNPPPKFEEIYPTCPAAATTTGSDETDNNIRPPSNEDLPSYDEAMKLQNTIPSSPPPPLPAPDPSKE